ncbi:hypothetical protein A3F00_04020 [Candidatus Daviesbacteria bacterium RIFCSPHIGHO2_12_FULL_37_11]|uniref:Uncharacterized protein n=1 Tax=Candidatus Daviesbacteria bacterium RIFCSPHIGHO2_12_FULL_37_11 TaxID=1797777 RepID=A0A1F5KE58_9BACT|nr:MAG: hypothetical protein A3F00_04020 [Candidatus Daviesbacteria bacterium RIFCSPHIGHO2_12_FULL_37_11]
MEIVLFNIDLFNKFLREALNEAWAVNLLEFVSVLVLSLTLLASLWAVRKSGEANELKLLPVLVILYSLENGRDIFRIKNIGYGTAFDINIRPLFLYLASLKEWYALEFLLHEPYLEHNQIKRLSLIAKKEGRVIDAFEGLLLAVFKEDGESAIITFTDARGKKYYCKVKIEKDRATLVELPKNFTMWKRGWFYLIGSMDNFSTEMRAKAKNFRKFL